MNKELLRLLSLKKKNQEEAESIYHLLSQSYASQGFFEKLSLNDEQNKINVQHLKPDLSLFDH